MGNSQGNMRLFELFVLWAILYDVDIDMNALILNQFVSRATSSTTHIITGGIISSIASSLGVDDTMKT